MSKRGRKNSLTARVMEIAVIFNMLVVSACTARSTPNLDEEPTRLPITEGSTSPPPSSTTSPPTNTPTGTPGPAPERPWDYVALGDSFTGRASWPDVYASFIEQELGVQVSLHNEAIGGQSASAALERMRSDDELRRLIQEAEVVTLQLGVNSLEMPLRQYSAGFGCGGEDNQDCIRKELASVEADWNALLDELVSLRNPEEAHMVTFKFGTWLAEAVCGGWGNECWEVLSGYFLELNEFIESSAKDHGIHVVDVNQAFNGSDYRQPVNPQYILSDGVHLSAEGSAIVADLLREPGYPMSKTENSTAAKPVLRTFRVIRDIPYHTALNEEVTEDKLDIYSPTDFGDWPVVVVFHGGASGGKGEEVATLSKRLAEQGAVVLTPDIHSIRAEADEPAGMREYLEKVDCVVRFARAHVATYGGDPSNMVVFGQSAGGYGGFWVSLVGDKIEQLWDNYHGTQGDAERQVGCLAEGSADHVDAFVGFGGAYAYFEVNLGPLVALGLAEADLLEVLSPSSYFGENPELVIRFIDGERDLIVPEAAVRQHKVWIEALAEMGYDATWMDMVGGHGLDERTFDAVVEVIMEAAQR